MKKVFSLVAFLCVTIVMYAQVVEQFTNSNIGNSYSSGTFVGDGNIVWNYVNARGNQKTTTNNDKAISLNKAADACLFSDTITKGIKVLKFQYEQELTANCDASVFINDSCVGVLKTDNEADVTKFFSYSSQNFPENAVIRIQQNSAASGQLTIDDIYIEYAKTPFVCLSVNLGDTISACYSHKLSSYKVETIPENALKSTFINGNCVCALLQENLCGSVSVCFKDVVDTAFATLSDTTLSIDFFSIPSINDVVFTEIMADPSPVVGLPEFEYVEMYNNSDCAVQCSDLQIVIGTNAVKLPQKVFDSQTYLTIISSKAKSYIQDTSNYLFLDNFPAITNAGQTITLLYNNELISSVTFSDSWYGDKFKADGGWSLEKIDIENVSETKGNWLAANNRLGGSPGKGNSVSKENNDIISPEILSIQIVSDTTVFIQFSENINKSVFESVHFQDNEIVKIEPKDFSLSKYQITTKNYFQHNQSYNIDFLQNCTDFAGNQFVTTDFNFAITDSIIQRNSIVINEILFNPLSGNSDFVELYNNSNSYFDLSQLYVSNGIDFTRVSEIFLLFAPHTYALISPDADIYKTSSAYENSLFISSKLPTFPDDEGLVMLVNKWEEVIDSVAYSEKWHSSYISDVDGVSLERIDFSLPSEFASTWFSAAESVGFSTPAYENSQYKQKNFHSGISLESDVVTPNGDGDCDELLVLFGETDLGTMCNVRIFSTSGRWLRQIANNQLLGENDIIRWDCTNSNGNLLPSGIYLVHIELLKNGKKIHSEKIGFTILRE